LGLRFRDFPDRELTLLDPDGTGEAEFARAVQEKDNLFAFFVMRGVDGDPFGFGASAVLFECEGFSDFTFDAPVDAEGVPRGDQAGFRVFARSNGGAFALEDRLGAVGDLLQVEGLDLTGPARLREGRREKYYDEITENRTDGRHKDAPVESTFLYINTISGGTANSKEW